MITYKHKDLTEQIINAAYTVHNTLCYGFLEKVYHNSLVIELKKRGIFTEQEKPIAVKYDNIILPKNWAHN
jgi:GxxExxY protein